MAQIQIISGANLKAGDSTNKNPFIFPHSQTPRDRHDKKKPVANLLLLCSHRQVGPLCHSLQGQRKVAPDKNEKFHVGSSVVRFAQEEKKSPTNRHKKKVVFGVLTRCVV
jgi:hypothetical protein